MFEDESSFDASPESEQVRLVGYSPFDYIELSSELLPRGEAEDLMRDNNGDVIYEIHS